MYDLTIELLLIKEIISFAVWIVLWIRFLKHPSNKKYEQQAIILGIYILISVLFGFCYIAWHHIN